MQEAPTGPRLVGRRGFSAARHDYFFADEAAGAAAELALLLFTACLVECFLVCFFTLEVEAAGAEEPLAGGVAGVCAANVRGMVAKARAMVIKVVFIFPFLPRGLSWCPLTIPSCGRRAGNTIDCAGYSECLMQTLNG